VFGYGRGQGVEGVKPTPHKGGRFWLFFELWEGQVLFFCWWREPSAIFIVFGVEWGAWGGCGVACVRAPWGLRTCTGLPGFPFVGGFRGGVGGGVPFVPAHNGSRHN